MHHFYLIDIDIEQSEDFVREFLEKKLEKNISPFLTFQNFETLTIDDARDLKHLASETADPSSPRIVSISASAFTHEALQALLKTLEEPAPNVHFFVSYNGVKNLPETIRSRAEIIFSLKEKIEKFDAKKFLEKKIKDRILDIVKIVDSHENDETSGPMRMEAKEIIVSILDELHNDPNKNQKEFNTTARTLLSFLPYLESRGANVRMILEHVILAI